MKSKSRARARSRCKIKASRWASYAVAGAAATVAAREAGAQYTYFYSGVLDTHIQTSSNSAGPPPIPANVEFTTLTPAKTSWFIELVNNQAGSPHRNHGFDYANVGHFSAHASLVAFKASGHTYASRLGKSALIKGKNFLSGRKILLNSVSATGNFKWNVPAGTTGFLGFTLDQTESPAGTYYGWMEVEMLQGAPHHGMEVISYAYSDDPSFETGQIGAPVVTGNQWTGGAANGNWNLTGNWTGGAVPGIAGATNATATSTDTALFDQAAPITTVIVDSGRNVMNLTFDTAAVPSMIIGATGGPALLLSSGGMIQMTSIVGNSQTVNAPLVLEGNYTFVNNASTATLTIGGGISSGASSGTTTLTLNGASNSANALGGVLADGSAGSTLALSVQGGSWNVTAPNTFSGGTTVSSGVLTVANTTGSGTGTGPVGVSGGSLIVTGSVSGTVNVTGGSATINGSAGGALNVTTGSALVAGSVAGTVTITSGSVTVNGSVAGPVVVNGGTLAGSGNINGPLSVNSGGTLAPGAAANLKVNNTAGLASGSILSYTLSTAGVANAGTAGGNTLTTVSGALTLNPNETVDVAAGANFGTGTYVLAHYTSLTDNSSGFSGWTVTGPSSNNYTFQIDSANKDVELVSRPKTPPIQNLFVSVNGYSNGNGSGSGGGVNGDSVQEYVAATGAPITYASVNQPIGLGFDSLGNLYVTDNNSPTSLWQVAPGGLPAGHAAVKLPASGSPYAYGLTVDKNNNVYVTRDYGAAGAGNGYVQISQSPYNSFANYAQLSSQYGLATDPSGNIWVTDGSNVQEFAAGPGNGGTSLQTVGSGVLTSAFGIAFDSSSNMYVTNEGSGQVFKFAYSGGTYSAGSLFASVTSPFGVAVNAAGDVFVSSFQALGSGNIYEFAPNGTALGAISSQSVAYPTYLAFSGGSAPYPAWTGATDTTWAGTGNWSTGLVPGSTSSTIDTDTALFNQTPSNPSNSPLTIDANRNLMNITFDNSGGLLSSTLTIGTTGGNPLLLTDGGTTQITTSVANPQNVNAPLVLEGTPGALSNSYNFVNNSSASAATFTFAGAISSGASMGVTTLNLAGTNAGTNIISGAMTDGGHGSTIALAVQGSTWSLAGANAYSGGTAIANGATLQLANASGSAMTNAMNVVNAGSLVVATPNQIVGTVTGSGNTVVNANSSLTAYQIRQNSLIIGSGATVSLSPSGSGSTTHPAMPNNINFSSSVTSLSIAGTLGAWTGTLDIGNNGLVIAYGNPANDPYTTIDNMIESGYNGGVWGGKGITSTLAQAGVAMNISTPLNIGLLDFTPGTGNYTNQTFLVFEGQTVTTNAILVRLTYMDDIVLAGDMAQNNSTSDALLFAANFGTGTTWAVGDLTHDGMIDSNDALLFAANFSVGLPSLDGSTGNNVALAGGEAAVPEPTSLGLLTMGAAGLLAYRQRQNRKAKADVA